MLTLPLPRLTPKLDVPVIPIFIENAPRSPSMVWVFFRRSRVRLIYGQPLDLSAWQGKRTSPELLAEVTDHIMGSLALNEKQSDRILSQSRTERTAKAQLAYRTANERFTYHVSRDNKKVKPTPVQSFRISREARDAGNAFLAMFDNVEAAVKALRALSK